MKWHHLALVAVVGIASLTVQAQVAGTQPLSVTVQQSQALLQGWSAKKGILGKAVYNDKNEKIGSILSLIDVWEATKGNEAERIALKSLIIDKC